MRIQRHAVWSQVLHHANISLMSLQTACEHSHSLRQAKLGQVTEADYRTAGYCRNYMGVQQTVQRNTEGIWKVITLLCSQHSTQ